MMKPLGRKAYGSIPHLLGSKLGEGDHHVHEGQHKICCENVRDKHDLIIVQEKYDGSNVAVANIDNKIVALTRAGYTAESSPYSQHHYFAKWVKKYQNSFLKLLNPNERLVGEWLLQAHGLKYSIESDSPIVFFDLFSQDNVRLPYDVFLGRIGGIFETPRLLHRYNQSLSIESALQALKDDTNRNIFCLENEEGVIYRVERKGKVDFLAKFVRNDFKTGKYLPEISLQNEVFNFDVSLF